LRKRIEKRFAYLYTGELAAVICFIIVSWLWNEAYPQYRIYSLASFWLSFIFLEFLLVQGSMYWFSKWKQLKKENTPVTPIKVVLRMKKLQKMNIVLIIVTPFVFVLDIFRWYPLLPAEGLTLSAFVFIFAILEYINYFHIQLSYDNQSDIQYLFRHKKLKRASLSKDFERLKK
jgi:hypothetical protein